MMPTQSRRRCLLPRRRRAVHPGAARPVEPGIEPARQPVSAWSAWRSPSLTTLAAHPPASPLAWVLVVGRHRHRRRHRRGDRAPRADDGDAGTGRRLPLAGRPGRGAGGGGRALRAGGLRHRHARATSTAPSLIEMSLGVAIGAITFTGSVIAFLKLSGRMSGKPIMLPRRHVINIALGAGADRSSSPASIVTQSALDVLADRRASRSRSAS